MKILMKDPTMENAENSILPLSKLNVDMGEKISDGKEVIILVGVNGSGKTTTAAKLGNKFRTEGKKVLFAATDTFRAAGGAQLELWGDKLNIPVISGDKGADPGSVLFNALNSFISREYDVLIVDTAGRVQSRENLMKELSKLVNIVKKFIKKGPSDIFLVIDTTMGQNTIDQVYKFSEFAGITGIVLAKIDGTAKGGTVIRIADETGIPVRFIGTGETEADFGEFSPDEFLETLLGA